MTRHVFPTLTVLVGLALTAVLLGWPRGRWELTGGGVSVPHGRSARHTEYSHHGLLNYLTVREDRGTGQPPGWYLDLDPVRTFLTGVLVAAIWATVGRSFIRSGRTAEPGAAPDRAGIGLTRGDSSSSRPGG